MVLAEIPVEVKAEDKTVGLIAQLRAGGLTYQQIADNLGVNWRTVHRWGKGTHTPIHAPLINTVLQHLVESYLVNC